MKSIRIFLVVVLIATITLVNFISATHGYRESMREAQKLFNDQLLQQAQLLSAFPYQTLQGSAALPERTVVIDNILRQSHSKNIAFQVYDQDKRLLIRSANSSSNPIRAFEPGFKEVNFSGYRWNSFAIFNDKLNVWIFVAERSDIRYIFADSIIMKSVLPSVVALPFIGMMIWFIVSFGLKPIKDLATQLQSKRASDLSPLTLDTVPVELALLATSANDLLGRVEASFEREKRFNSDVAHELRTPIAALKIHLQNLMADMIGPAESLEKLKQGVDRMNYLVEQILMLNRMTPDYYLTHFTNIDLVEITKKVVAEMLDLLNSKEQQIEFKGESCEIYGDAFAIEILIKNILSNAIKYTPRQGQIKICTSREQMSRKLRITDNGPGISPEQYERVFERFYRIGGDRHDSTVIGCGLGLSIVRHITDIHDATIELEAPEAGGGLCVTVTFPAKS